MMKKIALLTVVLLTIVNIANVFGEPTQLNWLGHWKGEDKREQLVEEVKKEYEFLNPEVQIHFLYDKDLQTQGDNYKWKTANEIVDMIKTGDIRWDVITLGGAVYNHVAELLGDPEWGAKHLVDFSTVPGFLQTQEDFIVNDPYYKNQTGGIFVGPLIEGFITCLWYNPEVAEKAGIKVKSRGMTVDDFLSYAEKLSEYNRRNYDGVPFIKLCSWNRLETLFEYLFRTQLDSPEEGVEEKYSEKKKKAFLSTLLIFEEFARFQPVINKDWKSLDWEQWKQGFLDGDGLFVTAGTYMYSGFRGIDPVKFSKLVPVESPYVKKTNGLVGDYINTFAVMKKSSNKKAAIDLLMLWSEPKVAEKWITYTKNPTGIKGHLDDPVGRVLTDNVYNNFVREMTRKYGNMPMRYFRAPSYVFGSENPVTANELREKLAEILEGKLSAQAYFDDVIRRYQNR